MGDKAKNFHPDTLWLNSIPEPNSGCWIWMKAVSSNKYPQLLRNGYGSTAASVYARWKDPKFRGIVRHTCDNTYCVNPDHFILGTPSENYQDYAKRGKSGCGQYPFKITDQQLIEIYDKSNKLFADPAKIAKEYNVSRAYVYAIRKHRVRMWVLRKHIEEKAKGKEKCHSP